VNAAEVASLLNAGVPLGRALSGASDDLLGKLEFALSVGAPLGPFLTQLDRISQDERIADFELEQALAIPRATRRLLLWLPLFSLLFAQLLGLATLNALLNPLVLISFLLAGMLLFIGAKISSRQLKQLSVDLEIEPMQHFMLALSAGLGLAEIRDQMPAVLSDARVRRLINIGLETGARLSPLVQAEISFAIANKLADQIEATKRLSVRILVPLGLTTLPAFMLLTVPPILVGSLK